jgi:predicted methyltransferase
MTIDEIKAENMRVKNYLLALGREAMPTSEDDYQSERQIDSENRFIEKLESYGFDISDLEGNGMTTDERIIEQLRRVSVQFHCNDANVDCTRTDGKVLIDSDGFCPNHRPECSECNGTGIKIEAGHKVDCNC